MPIDLQNERLIRFCDVPDLPNLPLRRKGARLHVATVHRWHNAGVRGIRLAAVRCGGTWCTTAEAIQRFFAELTAAQEAAPLPPAKRRDRDHAAVERQLDDANIK